MKKRIREQLLEIMSDLRQTAGGLDEILAGYGLEESLDLLAQMQELVLEAGNTIEKSEGAESGIIRKLEEACELIYQISCSLEEAGQEEPTEEREEPVEEREELQAGSEEQAEDRRELLRKLERLFAEAGQEIERKIPAGKEVLFLPYQVSMWDALESVWMAAKEDPDTDCYVVPIPYYDLRPDDSLGELHYDGYQYPHYVPVVHYTEYSIEERKPDMIFIHNPYDECNRVTRIPEQYYAKNIQKYTKMLVYISYFVSEEEGPANHQCYQPGVLYADRVVVQPGRVYEKYCRVYTHVMKQNGWEKYLVPAREKFLPLGSPKVDKLMNMNVEIEYLPESWRKIILKPDGSRKKVIFYNLSIGSLLQNREQMLRKIDNVFQFFRERKEECVLLWRPHPLLMGTLGSMVPWLRDEYLRKVNQFKAEGWGIYDETPDPNLGMALSDGYYGDESSLLTLYRETGKPILLQDVNVLD